MAKEINALVDQLIVDQAGDWDRTGVLPMDVLRKLGADGLLCAEVPPQYGGPGLTSRQNGELTAHVGSLCGSTRSILTAQGMAAWTIFRLGDEIQRREFLSRLVSGDLAAAALSEPHPGLPDTGIRIVQHGPEVSVDGCHARVVAAGYADLLVVSAQYRDGAAVVVVPTDAQGVEVKLIAEPLGCRAAGYAIVTFDDVRLPANYVLHGAGGPLPPLVNPGLAFGRLSTAWGCAGILRGCLRTMAAHAEDDARAEHELAELYVAEQTVTRICEHASVCWAAGSAELVPSTVLAKQAGVGNAARGAALALRSLGGEQQVVRAFRDAKVMEISEGGTEVGRRMLARHVLSHAA
ncbi:MAG TPA: acyl-CoA dehydrogenase family protein [Amycolatopsis sp.]|nr:acyl-CoA dehydrogenase family protein [Amycolatopsis sp.]